MNATTVKLSVRQWASEDRPSNKLQNLGAAALSDSELLAILVGSGTPQHNAVEIGQQIMSRFDHSLGKLAKADFREIKDIDGVGTYTACKILAAIELGKRRQLATASMAPDLSTATAIYNYATIIVFCHNHPSGNICPSRVDDELTKSIKRACDLMRIHFCDYVIVGDCQYYSYRKQGKL